VSEPVVVTGVGAVTAAFGGGRGALEAFLAAARSAAPPAASRRIPGVEPAGVLDGDETRRLSRICRLAVASARLALADARLPADAPVGLVLGTERGDLRSTIAFSDGYLDGGLTGLSALLFPATVMNTVAAAATIAVGARAASLTLNALTVAGHMAVAQAAAAVASGRMPAALAGGADELVDLVEEGLEALGATEHRGEGSAFLLLEPRSFAERRGAPILAEILGASWQALPAGPHGVGRTVASRAIARALALSGVEPGDVGWVYGSDSGDRRRDAWERAIRGHGLGDRPVPAATLASCLGHHAGVGPLAVAAAAWTGRTGALPATAGTGWRAVPVDRGRPGLVHGVARGGAEVALVVRGSPGA
jgi:3-oxoacyl-(acyl-carrier-protein) synthase